MTSNNSKPTFCKSGGSLPKFDHNPNFQEKRAKT